MDPTVLSLTHWGPLHHRLSLGRSCSGVQCSLQMGVLAHYLSRHLVMLRSVVPLMVVSSWSPQEATVRSSRPGLALLSPWLAFLLPVTNFLCSVPLTGGFPVTPGTLDGAQVGVWGWAALSLALQAEPEGPPAPFFSLSPWPLLGRKPLCAPRIPSPSAPQLCPWPLAASSAQPTGSALGW